jgi:hypothetical protein
VIEAEFEQVGDFYGTAVVAVVCPLCDFNQMIPLEIGYECLRCGCQFKGK